MSVRRIGDAVDHVWSVASREEARTLDGLFAAVARDRGRSLTVDRQANLPPGVFGRWLAHPDRDEVECAAGVAAKSRTRAHELGHIVLGHQGVPVANMPGISPMSSGLAALMLCRGGDLDANGREELHAEWFASMLLARLAAATGARDPRTHARLYEVML